LEEKNSTFACDGLRHYVRTDSLYIDTITTGYRTRLSRF